MRDKYCVVIVVKIAIVQFWSTFKPMINIYEIKRAEKPNAINITF